LNLYEQSLFSPKRAHRTDVRTLSISSTGGFFVSGSQESAIVWDMEEGFSLRNKFVADGMAQISASLIVSDDKAIVLGTRVCGILNKFT
jgi:hypothetical protein